MRSIKNRFHGDAVELIFGKSIRTTVCTYCGAAVLEMCRYVPVYRTGTYFFPEFHIDT
jgi:hypothetical protein